MQIGTNTAVLVVTKLQRQCSRSCRRAQTVNDLLGQEGQERGCQADEEEVVKAHDVLRFDGVQFECRF